MLCFLLNISTLFLLLQTATLAHSLHFSSFRKSQCPFTRKTPQESLLKPTNYLNYLFTSYFFIGEDVDPRTLERGFQSTFGFDQLELTSQSPQKASINIGIVCSTPKCQDKFLDYLSSNNFENPPRDIAQINTTIRILVESQPFQKIQMPLRSKKISVFIEDLEDYSKNFQSKVRYGNIFERRKSIETFMQTYKEFFFVPESFFENPVLYVRFIASEPVINKFFYAFWDGSYFSEKLIIPGYKNYIDYVDLMTDAWDDWHERKTGKTQFSKYRETVKFIQDITNIDEFLTIISSAFVYKGLYQTNGRDTFISTLSYQKNKKIFLNMDYQKLKMKSVLLFSQNSHFHYSSKYLCNKIFRTKELQDVFHNDHWSRYNQFKSVSAHQQHKGEPEDSLITLNGASSTPETQSPVSERDQTPPNQLMDLVITCGVGIDLTNKTTEAFFKTFREFDQKTDIVLFVDILDIEKYKVFSEKYQIRLEPFWNFASFIPGQINTMVYDNVLRFRAFHEFLKENPQYGRVFITDLTDVLFQFDFFEVLPSFNEYSSPFLVLNNLKGIRTQHARDELANHFQKAGAWRAKKNMFGLVGRMAMTATFNTTRICAGTIAGDRNTLKVVTLFIMEEAEHSRIQGSYDQSVLNYYMSKWAHVFPNSRLNNGFLFLRVEPFPMIEYHTPNCDLLELEKDRKAVCLGGECAPAIHQYDLIGLKKNVSQACIENWTKYLKLRGLEDLWND